MSYVARGHAGGPYVYSGTDGNMWFYYVPQANTGPDSDSVTIPQALFDEIALLRCAELVEDGELETVVEQLQSEHPHLRDRLKQLSL